MSGSSLLERPAKTTGAMFAKAALASELASDRRKSVVNTLRSDRPLVLRQSNPKGPEPLIHKRRDIARVSLAAAAAGPIGGDEYSLEVHVGAGSTLVLTEVSAMLVLPGIGGGQSQMSITVTVDAGATFVWWAEPIIAAHRCNHRHEMRIALAPDARLVLREEMLLGRHGEAPGDFTSRLRITRDGGAIYDQQLSFGPLAAGWDGAAVLDTGRATGSIIAVDPGWAQTPPKASPYGKQAALTPLAGPGVAIAAVAPDSLQLRRLLLQGLNTLGPPWAV